MKLFYLLIFLSFGLFQTQTLRKIKIIDAQDGKPIANARIIFNNEVVYSNDDGFALITENVSNMEVSQSGYQSQKITKISEQIKLKPIYNDIEEIRIVNVDIKELFKNVQKNLKKNYFSEPSLYDITYKQKDSDNDSLNFLMIANAKLWTSSNSYNFKSAFNKNYDDFIQIDLENIKYLKSDITDNDICKGYSLNQSKDFVGNIFLNYEMQRTNYYFEIKDAKFSGRLLNENGDEQTISFKVISSEIDVNGKLVYNKKDKALLYYELEYDQTKSPSVKRKTMEGQELEYKVGNGIIIYDFYKKDGKYFPAQSKTMGFTFCTLNNETHKIHFDREIVFQKHNSTQTNGLTNKIDLSKLIWKNVPTNQSKESKVLLSQEEEKFVNEKSYEKSE